MRERQKLLAQEREKILAEINRLGAELGRFEGAIQDCAYWLERIAEEEKKGDAPPELRVVE